MLVNSFGNNKRNYLYSKEWSDVKYNLAIEIINKHDVFSGYKQTDTYVNAKRPYDWIRNRIEKYEFQENQDFITVTKNLVNGGRETDYVLKLDIAKELSKVS